MLAPEMRTSTGYSVVKDMARSLGSSIERSAQNSDERMRQWLWGTTMKITILGPTGPTGRQLVAQALARGHEVTAFARRPTGLPIHPGLITVPGSIADGAALDGAIAGRDALLCALGGRPWRRRERVCSTAMRHAIASMQHHHVRRLVAISTFGAGETRSRLGWLVRHLVFGAVLRSEVADKEAMEAILEKQRARLDGGAGRLAARRSVAGRVAGCRRRVHSGHGAHRPC